MSGFSKSLDVISSLRSCSLNQYYFIIIKLTRNRNAPSVMSSERKTKSESSCLKSQSLLWSNANAVLQRVISIWHNQSQSVCVEIGSEQKQDSAAVSLLVLVDVHPQLSDSSSRSSRSGRFWFLFHGLIISTSIWFVFVLWVQDDMKTLQQKLYFLWGSSKEIWRRFRDTKTRIHQRTRTQNVLWLVWV